jgi:hypothetical protein
VPQPPVVPTMSRLASNVSASQYKTWKMCHRAWAFEKVWKVRKRQMQAHVVGHATHSVIERYILGRSSSWEGLFPEGWNKGLDADESAWLQRMIRAGIEKGVIQSTPGSLVELPVAMLTAAHHVDARGLPLLCKADTYLDETLTRRIANFTTLYDGSPLPADWNRLPPFVGFIDHLVLEADPPLVADHKTSKNRRYATTPKKLAEDVQIISYSAVPMVLRPEVTSVMARHNVYIKEDGGPDPYCVEVPITLEKTVKVWSEIREAVVEMERVRTAAPRIEDPSNPFIRANNWQRVTSAIEAGCTKEACSAYGGCPYKDVCYGRATAEQVVRRLDSPDPLTLVQKRVIPPPIKTFGLRPTTGKPMPFAQPKPAFTLNQDVYVLDPDDATTQFRARITALPAKEGDNISISIYPNPDIEPVFTSLPLTYRIALPKDAIFTVPLGTAQIKSYDAILRAAGVAEAELTWSPAVSVAPTTPAGIPTVETVKAVTRTERDNKFGLPGASTGTVVVAGVANPDYKPTPATGTALQSGPTPPGPNPATVPGIATLTPPKRNVPLTGPTEAWAKAIAPGALVEVIPNEHSFWAQHSGKTAIVHDVTLGDNDTRMFAIEIEGGPYPDVDSRRLRPKAVEQRPVTAADQLAPFKALIGQAVVVAFKSTLSSLNAVLEAVDEEGITLIKKKYLWDDISAFNQMQPTDVPGSKEAIKAAKIAIKATAAATAAASAPAINPTTALDQAIEAITTTLNGGKVTKKVLEGVLPLLQAAKANQAHTAPDGDGTVGYLRALDHAQAAIEALKQR